MKACNQHVLEIPVVQRNTTSTPIHVMANNDYDHRHKIRRPEIVFDMNSNSKTIVVDHQPTRPERHKSNKKPYSVNFAAFSTAETRSKEVMFDLSEQEGVKKTLSQQEPSHSRLANGDSSIVRVITVDPKEEEIWDRLKEQNHKRSKIVLLPDNARFGIVKQKLFGSLKRQQENHLHNRTDLPRKESSSSNFVDIDLNDKSVHTNGTTWKTGSSAVTFKLSPMKVKEQFGRSAAEKERKTNRMITRQMMKFDYIWHRWMLLALIGAFLIWMVIFFPLLLTSSG